MTVTFEDAQDGRERDEREAVIEALTTIAQRFDVFVANAGKFSGDTTGEARAEAYTQAQNYIYRSIERYKEGREDWAW